MDPQRKKLPIILEPEEAQKLLSVPNKRYITGLRNKVILNLMLNMGLRVSEVTNIKQLEINLKYRKLRIIVKKGRVCRDLVIPETIIDLLEEWRMRKPISSKYFFCTIKVRKDGSFASKKGEKLSVRYIQEVIKKYSEKAGIGKNITPYTLRHTFGTFFYRQTKDVESLRKQLGHVDINSTQIYVTLANTDLKMQ